VRVIHGKGTGALRETVLAALLGELSGCVHALASESGDGATLVALKGPR
jgi:dsDNA-specific endonuclease/ATPase MutS2